MDLFEIRLRQPFGIGFVGLVRAPEDLVAVSGDALRLEQWSLSVVLGEPDLVLPGTGILIVPDRDPDGNVRVAASGEATQAGDPASSTNSLLKAAANRSDIVEEAEHIEQVGLA
jgi:hypothetical protein